MRIALHYPTVVRLPPTPSSPSVRISEPPAIEGYLTRHRPKSNAAERIYLSSHDGHLFLCRPSSAHPPEPPLPVTEGIDNPAALVLRPFALGFASIALGEKKGKRERLMDRVGVSRIGGGVGAKEERRKERTVKSLESSRVTSRSVQPEDELEDGSQVDLLQTLEVEEKKRAFQQITDARGFVDLRDVTSIDLAVNPGEIDAAVGIFDIGGPEGLAVAEDKDLLVRQRSFTVTTKNGSSVRFEVSGRFSSADTRLISSYVGLLDPSSRGVGRPTPRSRHLLEPSHSARLDRADDPDRFRCSTQAQRQQLSLEERFAEPRRHGGAGECQRVEQGVQLVCDGRVPSCGEVWTVFCQKGSQRHVQGALPRSPRGHPH